MKSSGRGFYIFCVLVGVLVVVCGWALFADHGMATSDDSPQGEAMDVVSDDVPPAGNRLAHQFRLSPKDSPSPRPMDDSLLLDSLKDDYIPTQQIGERGSLDGTLATDYPMTYTESKYERLPNSPLFIFTDDMIWKEGEDTYVARHDALVDQSKHIQEAAIALSVSPRIEMEQVTGYRLVEIPKNTLFDKMGMVSGDVIVSINGGHPDMEPMALMFVNMAAGKQRASTIVYDHHGERRTVKLRSTE